MTDSAVSSKTWAAAVDEIICRYAEADANEFEEICNKIAANYGSDAADEVRGKWIAARSQSVGEQKVIAVAPAKPVPVPKPRPAEPKAKPKSEPPPNEPPSVVRLNPQSPYDNAEAFQRLELNRLGTPFVWHWEGKFWRWNGQFYEPFSATALRGDVWKFLHNAKRLDGVTPFVPKKTQVDELINALQSCLALDGSTIPPLWLNTGKPAPDWVVFRNGIVNVCTGESRPLTHRLWAHAGLGFNWDPDARCPNWERFLQQIFPDDQESWDFVEEWLGYCMTGETHFEKAALFVGEPRSGKSTIANIASKLVGEGAFVGLSFHDWLASPKAAQVLLGKRVGVFGDVRFKQGRAYGSSYDPGGIDHRSSELLLKITGRDDVTIGRMYDEAWTGKLPIKFMMVSNEVPNFNDRSGALQRRFIKLHFTQSFLGKEDVELRRKLEGELPGIAARCIRAYARLRQRGAFIQPESGRRLDREVQAASDPWSAMAMDCFIPDPEGTVVKLVAYNRFESWCRENRRHDLWVPQNRFGARLREVPGFERLCDAPRGHGAQRAWLGMRLAKASKSELAATVADLVAGACKT